MAAYQGYGYNKIARMLTERKVITPAAYQARRSGRSYDKDPYEWNLCTVSKILDNQTYLGHLVSGKRRIASFKNKKSVKQPEDKWIVVENQFPALVSKTLWNDAHERLKTRKRDSSTGFINIFAGLVKCADCGYALGITNAKTQSNYFVCQTYSKKGKAYCSSHYITYETLYKVVLADLREMLRAVRENREEFRKQVLRKIGTDDDAGRKLMEQEISDLTRRIEDLSVKYDHLYDDRLDGLLSEKKFREMAERCEAEQSRAEVRLAEVKEALDGVDETMQSVEEFIKAAGQYEELEELDKEILNRLVSSITVGQKIRDDMGEHQEIRVNYRFLGSNPSMKTQQR